VVHGGSDGGYVGACGGELGQEGRVVGAVVGDAAAGGVLVCRLGYIERDLEGNETLLGVCFCM
jgi:hypothetical protein